MVNLWPNSNRAFGLKKRFFDFVENILLDFFFFNIISNAAAVYPNAPVVHITSPIFAPFLFVYFFTFPNNTTCIEISVPWFVSPPNNWILNSLHAFEKPFDNSSTCFFDIVFGNVTDIIQNFGIIPFAAKSLTLETMLFLEISDNFEPFGISVLSTNVSTPVSYTHLTLPTICRV